jgi:hypothetical protein
MATNGVSNVGSMTAFFGEEALFVPEEQRAKDMTARWITSMSGVRARDGEFLVGCMTIADSLRFIVSYDASIMDKEMVDKWKVKMETLFKPAAAQL